MPSKIVFALRRPIEIICVLDTLYLEPSGLQEAVV